MRTQDCGNRSELMIEAATQVASAQASATKAAISMAVLKSQLKANETFVNMIEQVAKSAPVPEGQGKQVDISA